jgi:hypothetical protein
MLRIVWNFLVHSEVFIDDSPWSKQVKFLKLPKKIQSFGINRVIELFPRVMQVIIRVHNQEIFRLDLTD